MSDNRPPRLPVPAVPSIPYAETLADKAYEYTDPIHARETRIPAPPAVDSIMLAGAVLEVARAIRFLGEVALYIATERMRR